jgi:hypothetical protein
MKLLHLLRQLLELFVRVVLPKVGQAALVFDEGIRIRPL